MASAKLPPETVALPGVPDELRLKRDKALAALVITNGITIAEAAGLIEEAVDGAINEAMAKLIPGRR